jgi:hypothetical protein
LLVVLLPVTGLIAATSRARWTTSRLLGVLAIAQGGFHLAFSVMAQEPATHHAVPAMLAWHLIATAVCTVLILRAERWLWLVLTALRPQIPRGTTPRVMVRLEDGACEEAGFGPARWLVSTLGRIRRGPPEPRTT